LPLPTLPLDLGGISESEASPAPDLVGGWSSGALLSAGSSLGTATPIEVLTGILRFGGGLSLGGCLVFR
jgi:hypothetical protein